MRNMPNGLVAFAAPAVLHASQHYGVKLDWEHPEYLDRILDGEREKNDPELHSSIALCYGAWLGQWAIQFADGEWVGFHEPTPPRICVHGVMCSPIDAIQRRLVSDQAPAVESLIEQLKRWSQLPVEDTKIQSQNRTAWDAKDSDARFVQTEGLPTNREEAIAAIDPWVLQEGSLEGRRVLCLAAAGGMHGPLFAVSGANVTVVDFSAKQLDIDRRIAKNYALKMETVQTSIDDLSALLDASFDLVIQPVSSCYLRNIQPVYAEVARVLRPEGLYISQHKQPTSQQADFSMKNDAYAIERPSEDGHFVRTVEPGSPYHESGVTEFVHTWDALVGGLCRSGFVVEDLQEPPRGDAWAPLGSPEHRARYISPYVKIKARRCRPT